MRSFARRGRTLRRVGPSVWFIYELLTKRWPYEAETMPELVLKVVTEPPAATESGSGRTSRRR